MGLQNYKPRRHEFPLGEADTLSVRGLSLEDISALVQHHLPDIEALFDLFANLSEQTDQQFETVVVSLLQAAPGLAANIIALAADEPDHPKEAAMLPAPLQVEVLLKIGNFTFEEVGGVKKGMESIAALLKKTNAKSLATKVSKRAGHSGSI